MVECDWWLLAFQKRNFRSLMQFQQCITIQHPARVSECGEYTLSMWFGIDKHFKYSIWNRPYALVITHTRTHARPTLIKSESVQFELEWVCIQKINYMASSIGKKEFIIKECGVWLYWYSVLCAMPINMVSIEQFLFFCQRLKFTRFISY